MNIVHNFITEYGFHIIAASLTGIISYLGVQVKNIIQEYIKHKIAKEEAEIVYKAVEKMYPNLQAEEKMKEMTTDLQQILKEKNIEATELELKILLGNAMYHTIE